MRIDTDHSLLVIRSLDGLTYDRFQHKYVSELLRLAIAASVGVLDRYMHDLVIYYSITILRKPESKIKSEFKKISLPLLEVFKAVEKARTKEATRPANLIKKALQDRLHIEKTFQGPVGVEQAVSMLGVENFWKKASEKMPNNPSPMEIRETLNRLTKRRNQIVHEADVVRKTRGKENTLRDISRKDAAEAVGFIKEFAVTIDEVVLEVD